VKSSLKNIAKTPLAALALSLALAGMAQAGTLDEVKSLWDPRESPVLKRLPAERHSPGGERGISATLVTTQQRKAGGPARLESGAVHAGTLSLLS
jgi:hypothetical protein